MKETIAVLFGGQSSEHIVSCMSAANVIDHKMCIRDRGNSPWVRVQGET